MSWMVKQKTNARREQKARLWRRRVLIKKGARLIARMRANADEGALAMLDEQGIVVAWYGNDFAALPADQPLEHHVSQFYLTNDVALGVPMRDLCSAAIHGISKQLGWRRATDGSIGWASTQIDAELLADGRLQGFAHVIRRAPSEAAARAEMRSLEAAHDSTAAGEGRPPMLGFLGMRGCASAAL